MGTALPVRKVSLVPLLLILGEIYAFADIYKYVDSGGTIHFVDDAGKIPRHLRNSNLVCYDDKPAGPARATTGVTILHGQVLIPVTLHYHGKRVSASFLVDTGAATTTITPEIARELGVDFNLVEPTVDQVLGGALLPGMRFTLDRIDVGPTSSVDLAVDIVRHDGPPVQFDGLLGMNYLRRYRYVIDVENEVVNWE